MLTLPAPKLMRLDIFFAAILSFFFCFNKRNKYRFFLEREGTEKYVERCRNLGGEK